MHSIKKTFMNEIYEFEEKMKKNPNAKATAQEVDRIHKLTDTVKNIDKIEMLESEGGYSEDGHYMGEGRIYGTSYGDGSSYAGGSYARGRGRNARRDSMGRYSREGGYSENDMMYARDGRMRGGYSRDGGDMRERLEEMMNEATDPKEREAIKRCMRELDD